MGANQTQSKCLEQNQQCNPLLRKLLANKRGLLQMDLKVPIYDSFSLSLVYTPGVGHACKQIQADPENAYLYTNLSNSIALVTDGSDYRLSTNPKWNIMGCIPQLEAQSLFYKFDVNVDAYPFIFDPKLTDTDEKFVENLMALSGTCSGIEFFNIKPETIERLTPKIKEANFNMVYLTPQNKAYIVNLLEKAKILSLFPVQYTTGAILRAAIDCRVKGFLPNQLFDKINDVLNHEIEKNKLDLVDKWLATQIIHKTTINYFFENGLAHKNANKAYILNRLDEYMVEGPCAYLVKSDIRLIDKSTNENSLELHKRFQGMVTVSSKIQPKSIQMFYNMVRDGCYESIEDEILENPQKVRELTFKSNWSAIITNGTAILGLGDIGAQAGLPVMEGKSCIFKQLGGVDVVPICIQEKDPKKFIEIVKRISPIFSAINLEDIKAPQCFEIEQTLKQQLDIPVFHDDQHGTAIVTIAAILNASKLMKKQPSDLKVIVNGGGAAGISISEMLLKIGVKQLIICDTKGVIYEGRKENMNTQKDYLASISNREKVQGKLEDAIKGADVFIGVSAPGVLTEAMVKSMSEKNLVLAMANPDPEILPEVAKKAGVFIMGTGRSDFKNQVNNSLVFPGIFRGALDVQARDITMEMKLAAAHTIANLIPEHDLSVDFIIPGALDTRVPAAVSRAVGLKAIEQGNARAKITGDQLEENIRNYILERQLLNFQL